MDIFLEINNYIYTVIREKAVVPLGTGGAMFSIFSY